MIREEEKDQVSGGNWKTYLRSVSWSERPPRKSASTPKWNSKARACLPPLQPLSIIRPSIEEWPRAGSDDLGVWPNPPTPGARPGSVTPRESSTSDQPPREFEFKKDKLAFFNKECSRILDHVYLGSDAIAKDREILRQNGITHVLNCVGFVCPEYFKNDLLYKTLWLQDCPSQDITSILYDVFDYFEDVLEQGGRVFVHCCQGVSRSTSLVIAYLMWKEQQSFDDAFQHVKAARGVTNPNVGFACQLLQCQKRVHALPASPTSVLRMYRMAPHSPYDPLHLVPKMLSEPGADKLDSRGAFIVHIPSALYVWTGKHCSTVMSDNARVAASQVIRYERAQGPVINVKEGEERFEFWDALNYKKSSADGCEVKSDMEPATINPCLDQRKLAEYDLDFEIFHGALSGGVVPPFPLSGTGSETCLPARENGWNKLRRKFVNGVMKEFITSSKLIPSALKICGGLEAKAIDTCDEVEDFVSPAALSVSSSDQCDSPDSFASYITSSIPGCTKSNSEEVGYAGPFQDTSLSHSPSFSLVDSFSSFLVNKPKSNSTSPSISPSASDYSSSFTFSPSSSNWSDISFVSAQPSPSGLESIDLGKRGLLEESVGSAEERTYILDIATLPPAEESVSDNVTLGAAACGGKPPSLVVHRGSSILSEMSLPSTDEEYQISKKLTRYLEGGVTMGFECSDFSCETSFQTDGEESRSVPKSCVVEAEVVSMSYNEKKYETFHASDDITNKVTDTTDLVLYQWPSMHKLDLHCGIFDSRSVYIILMPAGSIGQKVADVLYIWIGCDVSSKQSYSQLIRYDSKCDDYAEAIDRNILVEKGFSADAQIKIVKEGEEPVNLLKLLSRYLLNKRSGKDLDGGI